MRKIIVTGGAGFIGSALVRRLLGRPGAEIVVIDKLTYAASRTTLAPLEATGRLRLLVEDICNGTEMARIMVREQPDWIFHLAAETHVDRSINNPGDFVAANVTGTYNLLEAARRHWQARSSAARAAFRFVHVSTDEVFGSLGAEGQFDETTPYDPSSPYSATKAASDHLARAWYRTYGLPVIVSNCSNNFGPYQFPEKLIPLVTLNALDQKDLPVFGQGLNVRDWLFVEDHARALEQIAAKGRPGATYLVGGGNEHTNLSVVEMICDILDRLRPLAKPHRHLIRFVTDRPGHDFRYAVDTSRLRSELGWRPQHSFVEALERTIRWYIDNPDWWQPLRQAVYAGERLGLTETSDG